VQQFGLCEGGGKFNTMKETFTKTFRDLMQPSLKKKADAWVEKHINDYTVIQKQWSHGFIHKCKLTLEKKPETKPKPATREELLKKYLKRNPDPVRRFRWLCENNSKDSEEAKILSDYIKGVLF